MGNCSRKFLTISIPAYNDALSLKKLVEETEYLCAKLNLDFDILIVNDGSKDETLKIATEMSDRFRNITVVNHENNLGFGPTLREVFTLPDSEWVLFLPGDNQFPIQNLERFLLLINHFDFMIGFRKQRRDKINRKLYSYLYNTLVSVASGYDVNDVNSIVFFKRNILKNFTLRSETAFIHAELFIKAMQKDVRMIEVEVMHQEREFGFGKGGSLKVMLSTLLELVIFILRK